MRVLGLVALAVLLAAGCKKAEKKEAPAGKSGKAKGESPARKAEPAVEAPKKVPTVPPPVDDGDVNTPKDDVTQPTAEGAPGSEAAGSKPSGTAEERADVVAPSDEQPPAPTGDVIAPGKEPGGAPGDKAAAAPTGETGPGGAQPGAAPGEEAAAGEETGGEAPEGTDEGGEVGDDSGTPAQPDVVAGAGVDEEAAREDGHFGREFQLKAIMMLNDVIKYPDHYSTFESIKLRGTVMAVTGDMVLLGHTMPDGQLSIMACDLKSFADQELSVGKVSVLEGKLTPQAWKLEDFGKVDTKGADPQTASTHLLVVSGGE